jgi:hypothetical protein
VNHSRISPLVLEHGHKVSFLIRQPLSKEVAQKLKEQKGRVTLDFSKICMAFRLEGQGAPHSLRLYGEDVIVENGDSPSTPSVRPQLLISSPGISFKLKASRTKVELDLFFIPSVAIELTHIEVRASIGQQEICQFVDSTPVHIIEMSQHRKRVEAVITSQGVAKISLGCVISLFGTATFRDGEALNHEPINITTVPSIEDFGRALPAADAQ